MKVILPSGDVKEFEGEVNLFTVAKSISNSLAKKSVAAKVNDELVDMSTVLNGEEFRIEFITPETEEGEEIIRHSTAHLMAQAVVRLFPGTKVAIGPAIENGFYYDFDPKEQFTEEDLAKIEAEMKKIVKENEKIERVMMTREDAIKHFEELGEEYKVEIIKEIAQGEMLSFYKQGEFMDLCRGPHVPSTSYLKAFKLKSVAGAYWRGNSDNKMLQRIYGFAFADEKKLKDYLTLLEEAEKRDHRKLGKELDLFFVSEYGPGFPIFLPKGMAIRNTLINLWKREHTLAGYTEIMTPIMLNKELWETSGHWYNYRENMYTSTIDETEFAIKPMNCPGGIIAYKYQLHSYKDLPIRCGELGTVHRHEFSGALHGLMRVRCFTQDDAHIFMTPEQIEEEIIGVVNLIDKFYSKLFGFEYHIELSTKPEKAIGSDEIWEKAESALAGALEKIGKSYKLNPGDGAFYGPKLDFKIKDAIGRTWQCGTIQLDFNLPERFDISYIGEDGEKHRPVMIHRVVYGSIERFIGILIEHFAGMFPTWLAPVQVKVLPISDKHLEYGQKVLETLNAAGIRAEIDTRAEKIGYKIREAQMQKIPYMLVVGAKEEEENLVSVRSRFAGDEGQKSLDAFVASVAEEIATRERREVVKEDEK